ncbi:hypothetical protein SARC_06354 [Sphaeroforma arctica JP610]|uniref:Uncharacterized protein n=1 Tax=Sphaeroforma arctica JP610 TaxID=667725 RepID=A0A0L0FXE7_9EUKA|nr:hypothetical protein SARC_06354 [Sphaeroforma arctica JP610]KNC81319.1 hypothetical protein SARC_06354 [Sphaeroforma arctica JP610]|eukprot:XP_014155221.1 hypothetical protein SARC_06354 [Sphaeroforma arctica JP610]
MSPSDAERVLEDVVYNARVSDSDDVDPLGQDIIADGSRVVSSDRSWKCSSAKRSPSPIKGCVDLLAISSCVEFQEVPLGTGELGYRASLESETMMDPPDVAPRTETRPARTFSPIEYVINYHPSTDSPLSAHRQDKLLVEQLSPKSIPTPVRRDRGGGMLAQAADGKTVSESFQLEEAPVLPQVVVDPRLTVMRAPNIVLPDDRQQASVSKRGATTTDRTDPAFKRPRRWDVVASPPIIERMFDQQQSTGAHYSDSTTGHRLPIVNGQVFPTFDQHVGQARLFAHQQPPWLRGAPQNSQELVWVAWKYIVSDISSDAEKQGCLEHQALYPHTATIVELREPLISVWNKGLPKLWNRLYELRIAMRAFISTAYSGILMEGLLHTLDLYGPTHTTAYAARILSAVGPEHSTSSAVDRGRNTGETTGVRFSALRLRKILNKSPEELALLCSLYSEVAFDKNNQKYINDVDVKIKHKQGAQPSRQIYRTKDPVLKAVETEKVTEFYVAGKAETGDKYSQWVSSVRTVWKNPPFKAYLDDGNMTHKRRHRQTILSVLNEHWNDLFRFVRICIAKDIRLPPLKCQFGILFDVAMVFFGREEINNTSQALFAGHGHPTGRNWRIVVTPDVSNREVGAGVFAQIPPSGAPEWDEEQECIAECNDYKKGLGLPPVDIHPQVLRLGLLEGETNEQLSHTERITEIDDTLEPLPTEPVPAADASTGPQHMVLLSDRQSDDAQLSTDQPVVPTKTQRGSAQPVVPTKTQRGSAQVLTSETYNPEPLPTNDRVMASRTPSTSPNEDDDTVKLNDAQLKYDREMLAIRLAVRKIVFLILPSGTRTTSDTESDSGLCDDHRYTQSSYTEMPAAQFMDWIIPFDTSDIDSLALNFSWVDLSQQLWGPYDIEFFASHEDHVLVICCTKDGTGAYGKDAYHVGIQFKHCYMNSSWRDIDPRSGPGWLITPPTVPPCHRLPADVLPHGYDTDSPSGTTAAHETQEDLITATDWANSLHERVAMREGIPTVDPRVPKAVDPPTALDGIEEVFDEAISLELPRTAFPVSWMQAQEVTEEEMSARRIATDSSVPMPALTARQQPDMSELERQLDAAVTAYTGDLTRLGQVLFGPVPVQQGRANESWSVLQPRQVMRYRVV